ncbi:MAG: NAD(P)/FAD-dependent oxidoreductase [Ruminiclostridium sp.]|nr:NAD(P)/FAD-dependent oxidoreductase [Ruminiclostridium sp.]
MEKNFDCIVIGAGAAGMYAAVHSAANGYKTAIIEPNEKVGRKLAITGKGRCNVTNNCDSDEIMKNIPRNPRFLYSALSMCSPADVMSFFEGEGVPLKTERGNRVFPVSDKAYDIVDALFFRMKREGVEIIRAKAVAVNASEGFVTGVKTDKGVFNSPKVILATGGMSYPVTGSTGDGYKIARALGHTITPLKPSLVPIETEENCGEMMGLSLKNSVLSVRDNEKNKVIFKELGEMIFTHFGVSGPLVLSASSRMEEITEGRYSLFIDLKPALSEEQLDARVQRDFAERKNMQLDNALRKLLPEKIIEPLLKKCGIDPEKQCNSVTREERLALVKTVKAFSLKPVSYRPIAEAIITDGGVSVKEINPKTMESKIVGGLYFAGEIIDVTGFTGGFNLQIAFSTGYAAAQ